MASLKVGDFALYREASDSADNLEGAARHQCLVRINEVNDDQYTPDLTPVPHLRRIIKWPRL